MKLKAVLAGSAIGLSAIATSAHAAPVTSLSGTVIPMEELNIFTGGPVAQAPGIVWSSENPSSVFGYTNGYGFGDNGSWSGSPPMIATDDAFSTMEYAFSTLQAGVGGLINYSPGFDGAPTISVFDSAHTLIESSVLSFSTPGIGEFHGFLLSSATIAYFSLSGSFIGLRDLTITEVSAIPEPESYALLLAGLGLMGFVARRRKPALRAFA